MKSPKTCDFDKLNPAEINDKDKEVSQNWEKFAETEGKTYQALAKLPVDGEPLRMERKRIVLHFAPYVLEALEAKAKKTHLTIDELAEDIFVEALF